MATDTSQDAPDLEHDMNEDGTVSPEDVSLTFHSSPLRSYCLAEN